MPDIFPEVRKMTDALLTIPFDEDDKINPNKEEDDHIDDSVAAVRLEQMIDSLSAFRSNFTQINSL